MLKPVSMSKVRLICLKQDAPFVLKELHKLSLLHIKESKIPNLSRSGPLESFEELSARHIKIKQILSSMQSLTDLKAPKKKIKIGNILQEADALIYSSENFFNLLAEKEKLSKEFESLSSYYKSLLEFAPLEEFNFYSLNSNYLQFLLLKSTKEKIQKAQSILSSKKNCSFLVFGNILLVAIPKSEDSTFLEQFGTIISYPKISSNTIKEEIEKIKTQQIELKEKIDSIDKKINKFIQNNYYLVLAIAEALEIELERARIASFFNATDAVYYIQGWVEKEKLQQLKKTLENKFGKKILILEEKIDEHHDLPPTKLSNPKSVQPFQFLVEFLSTTNYRELDPSIIIFLTIPILYALIFGDAGYAFVSFLFAWFLTKKSKPNTLLNEISKIWAISAIPAFLAGIIYDEYFGFTHSHLLEVLGFGHISLYHGLHRVSSITTLMLICIFAGMIHLGFGFILGAINEFNHSKKHAIGKLSWIGIEIGGFFLISNFMFSAFSELFLISLAIFVFSIIVLLATEGPIATVEIPGLASNIMSYIRIAAVGVGGVILAEAINELLFPKLEFSLAGIISFIIILSLYLFAHFFACVLAMFESFIHGARLNIVEFFGKFYKGNGIKFSPFSAKRVYSIEEGD